VRSLASPPSEQQIGVRPFESSDGPAVVALLQRAFGRWPRADIDRTPGEMFAWKHLGSPFGPSRMSLAERDSAIVGFIARMPWRLSFAGRVRDVVRVVDIAVDPSSQRMGTAMRLIGAPRSRYRPGVALSWSNPNERSRRGAEKAGLARVQLRQYVGPGDVRGLASARAPASAAAESARTLLGDDRLLARVLDRGPGPRVIETALDAAFLRWRYASFEIYRAVAVLDPCGRAALAIFRVSSRAGWPVAHVCELLVEGRRPELARRALRAVRRASGASLLTVAMPSGSAAALAGLARRPQAHAIAVNVLESGIVPDPTRGCSWGLSLGDLELI
jgi:GNAT superfamily N-acetyltransferase